MSLRSVDGGKSPRRQKQVAPRRPAAQSKLSPLEEQVKRLPKRIFDKIINLLTLYSPQFVADQITCIDEVTVSTELVEYIACNYKRQINEAEAADDHLEESVPVASRNFRLHVFQKLLRIALSDENILRTRTNKDGTFVSIKGVNAELAVDILKACERIDSTEPTITENHWQREARLNNEPDPYDMDQYEGCGNLKKDYQRPPSTR